jgi:diguanylate cyclase (GGDEF)-like protein
VQTEIIELALNRKLSDDRIPVLLKLADQLLSMIGTYAPDCSSKRVPAIHNNVAEWRALLRGDADAPSLTIVAERILGDCDQLLEKVQADRADREVELNDLMRVLRDVINALRGDAKKFEAEVQRSTTAMEGIVEIQDIRELKRQLSREIVSIKHAVQRREETEARQCELLTSRVETLQQSLKAARAEASTDQLTTLPNRGSFDVSLREWIARAARTSTPFSMAIVDLDDFKAVNDKHGHQVGDRVLVAAAQVLGGSLENGDIAARWGGEEFAVLFQTGSTARARERLMAAQGRISPSYEYDIDGERRFVTFSFSGGVTAWADGDTPEAMMKRADKALYSAKRAGKKRIEARSRSFLHALVS